MHTSRIDSHARRQSRRRSRFSGLFFDDFADSVWLRENARIELPPIPGVARLVVRGEARRHPAARGAETAVPTLAIFLDGNPVGHVSPASSEKFELIVPLTAEAAARGPVLAFELRGAGLTNTLAWLGRVVAGWPGSGWLQRFRAQNKNRQLRLTAVEVDGQLVCDFANRHAPCPLVVNRRSPPTGFNVVGFFSAELGIGESARCMARAAEAAEIPAAFVPLRLPCKASTGDSSYAAKLRADNPQPVNVFHLDAPVARDIDTHHGEAFRRDKYNIGYWAWELPEFPDAWVPSFDFFEEIWCPSEFVRAAIAEKSPLPVLAMPHAIAFERPRESIAQLRAKFGLPANAFLFLFLYDLNSYSERKNPRAALAAFRESGLAGHGAALVVKVHGARGNEADLAALRAAVADLPGTTLLTDAFSRSDIYALEAACDAFVSLHRSEGFGLAVAECMFLGKPVIATDWSATAEYLNADNGCPVRAPLVTLDRTHGPYAKGQRWADPEIAHAAEWMRRLFADRALAARLGAAARATIEERFAPAVVGARYRRRLDAIASW